MPGETRWEPVKETTVLLGAQKIPLTYRDTIDMNSYGYKGILFEMNTAGTELEGKKITYTLGDWDNNQDPGFAELMKIDAIKSFVNIPGEQSFSSHYANFIRDVEQPYKTWSAGRSRGLGDNRASATNH